MHQILIHPKDFPMSKQMLMSIYNISTYFFFIGKNNIIEKRLRHENKYEIA